MPTFPKPEKRKKTKARQDRYESSIIATVRLEVFTREGHGCRFRFHPELGRCFGALQWCHLWGSKRAHTRGMAPDVRHTSVESLCACIWHHRSIDGQRPKDKLTLAPLTPLKANGPLLATRTELVHGEAVTTVCTVEIPQ